MALFGFNYSFCIHWYNTIDRFTMFKWNRKVEGRARTILLHILNMNRLIAFPKSQVSPRIRSQLAPTKIPSLCNLHHFHCLSVEIWFNTCQTIPSYKILVSLNIHVSEECNQKNAPFALMLDSQGQEQAWKSLGTEKSNYFFGREWKARTPVTIIDYKVSKFQEKTINVLNYQPTTCRLSSFLNPASSTLSAPYRKGYSLWLP